MLHFTTFAPPRTRRACAYSTKIRLAVTALAASASLMPAAAEQAQEIPVTIKNDKFDPAEIKVPAGEAVVLKISNLDKSAEEFESKVLRIEKVIAGGATATIRLRPKSKGSYPFVGEFHEDIAKGTLVAE